MAVIKNTGSAGDDGSQQAVNSNEALTDETAGQYVTFYLNNESFAFSMDEVREIVRLPDSVEVPLTPNSLVGLANLRGSVLPILDLRRLLNITESEFTDATRVVVADCNGTGVGLIVDRVSRVISVENESIEKADAVRSSINAEMLTGVVKNVEGHSLIQLLDAEQVVSTEFANIVASNAVADSSGVRQQLDHDSEDDNDDAAQLVSFVVDNQEYAFDIQQVEEIVRLPDEISQVPKAEYHVLGIINLRDSLLPLVNLRTMFNLAETELSEHSRILVVNLSDANGVKSHSVGIVVDHVKEVLRISADAVDSVPAMLSQGSGASDITGICRLDKGKRLVSVLSSEALFDNPAIQEALASSEQANAGENATMNQENDNEELGEGDETQLVVFQLSGQEFGISIEAVQEITRVPDEMNEVPQTADFIEGMINLRGAVLPVMDMRTRFGIDRMDRSDRQRILVLELNGATTGFITDAVAEVIRLSRSLIEDAPSLSTEQNRMMGKVVNLKEQNRMIQVLDASQLLDNNQLQEIAAV